MGFSAEKDQEEKGHFTQSLEAIWGDKRTRIRFPSACLPFCRLENYAHGQNTSHLALSISIFLFLSPDFTLAILFDCWGFPLLNLKTLFFFLSLLMHFCLHSILQPLHTSSHPYLSFLSPPYIYFLSLFTCILHLTHISQPACPPVCRWQLKLISVRPKHPIVHGACQVSRRHGNYAELSSCPVDIYRVEKPTLNLDQVAALAWALCLCQIRAKDHRVSSCIMCQASQGTFGTV